MNLEAVWQAVQITITRGNEAGLDEVQRITGKRLQDFTDSHGGLLLQPQD